MADLHDVNYQDVGVDLVEHAVHFTAKAVLLCTARRSLAQKVDNPYSWWLLKTDGRPGPNGAQ